MFVPSQLQAHAAEGGQSLSSPSYRCRGSLDLPRGTTAPGCPPATSPAAPRRPRVQMRTCPRTLVMDVYAQLGEPAICSKGCNLQLARPVQFLPSALLCYTISTLIVLPLQAV